MINRKFWENFEKNILKFRLRQLKLEKNHGFYVTIYTLPWILYILECN